MRSLGLLASNYCGLIMLSEASEFSNRNVSLPWYYSPCLILASVICTKYIIMLLVPLLLFTEITSKEGTDSNAVTILKQILPEDMFVSPSDLNVSVVIGQGETNDNG